MEIKYGLFPETHKPVRGMETVWNASMTAAGARSLALDCGCRDTAAALVAITPVDTDVILNLGAAPAFTHHRAANAAALPTLRLSAAMTASPLIDARVNFSHVLWQPCDDRLDRGDALSRDPVRVVKCGETAWVYVEIAVRGPESSDTRRADVALTLWSGRMFEPETLAGELALDLTVHPFRLPGKRDCRFHLDIWQHNCAIARAHGVEPWSADHFALLDKYIAALAELGQKCVTVVASDCPWSGQWCHYERRADADLYEYSIIPVTRRDDGAFTYDFAPMQRYIDLCAAHGIDGEITVFGLVNVWCDGGGGFAALAPDHPDGAKIRYFDASDGAYKYMDRAADIDAYVAALAGYFERTGQMSRVRLIADEPADPDRYSAALDRLAAVAPGFTLKAALNHADFIARFGDRTGVFVPHLESLSREWPVISRYMREMPDRRFLWYVCNQPPHPNTFLASPLTETLALGVLTARLGLHGFLRWGFTVWCRDPLADNRYFNWPAGDLNFVYPGPDGAPLLSLRYKALKRAVELAELLMTYRDRFGSDALTKLTDRVVRFSDPAAIFPTPDSRDPAPADELFSPDYTDYASLRRELLEALS